MTNRRFRVERVGPPGDEVTLRPDVAHHLRRVLRLGPGEPITLFDGEGAEGPAEVVVGPDGEIRARMTGVARALPARPPSWLILALLKPGPMDDALRMATEAGASDILVFQAERSQARPARDDRWRRVVEAAGRQCGRPADPGLQVAGSLEQAFASVPPGTTLFFADPMGPAAAPPPGPAAIVVGPEGGLSPRERGVLEQHAATPVPLGPWVLRAETAAACATSWLNRRG